MVDFLQNQNKPTPPKPAPVDDIRYTQAERLKPLPQPATMSPAVTTPVPTTKPTWWQKLTKRYRAAPKRKFSNHGAMRLAAPAVVPVSPATKATTNVGPSIKPAAVGEVSPPTAGAMHLPTSTDDSGIKTKPATEVDLVADKGMLFSAPEFRRRLFKHGLVIIIIGLLVAGGYLWLVWRSATPNQAAADLDAAIITAQRELSQFRTQRDALAADEQRFSRLRELLTQHRFWSRFFALLEKSTLGTVAYRSVTVDAEGRIIITATADQYRVVAEQLAVWQATTGIATVDFSTATTPPPSLETKTPAVVFTVALTLTPDFLNDTTL